MDRPGARGVQLGGFVVGSWSSGMDGVVGVVVVGGGEMCGNGEMCGGEMCGDGEMCGGEMCGDGGKMCRGEICGDGKWGENREPARQLLVEKSYGAGLVDPGPARRDSWGGRRTVGCVGWIWVSEPPWWLLVVRG